MGIELAIAYVPSAKLTEERMIELHQIIDLTPLNQLDSDALSWTCSVDIRKSLHEHIEILRCAEDHWREVFPLNLPDYPYVVLITGGPSYGEPPTDLYPTFSVIQETPSLWIQLAKWARQDRQPS